MNQATRDSDLAILMDNLRAAQAALSSLPAEPASTYWDRWRIAKDASEEAFRIYQKRAYAKD